MFGNNYGATILGGDIHASSAGSLGTYVGMKNDPGFPFEFPDGRMFRYVQADNTGLTQGALAISPAEVANHKNCAITTAAVVGDKTVTITLGATLASANQYAMGLLAMQNGAAALKGMAYGILGHPAAAQSASLTLTLAERVYAAISSGGTPATLQANPFIGISLGGASPARKIVGCAPIALAANAWGWVQVRGLCSVLAVTTTVVAGQSVIPGANGAVTVAGAAATDRIVGYAHSAAGASAEQCIIWLTLD